MSKTNGPNSDRAVSFRKSEINRMWLFDSLHSRDK